MSVNRKILLLLPLAALGLWATHVHSQSPSAPGSPREVVVEEAFVTLIDDVKVPATEIGMLMSIPVREGQSIDKDAILAEIDERETLAKKRVAEGELAAAQKQAENTAEIELAEKGIRVAEQELEAAYEVNRKAPGAFPDSEIRKLRFQLDRAFAQEKVARNENLIARVTTDVKKAQLDATAIELDLRQIRAPFKGQVIEIFKKRGEWVQAGEPIMEVAALEKLRVKGSVSSADAAPIEVIGKPVTITIDGAGNKKHTVKGIVGFASPIIDLSGEFRIWVEIDNERYIDPVTKQESWIIQPGSMASMRIDLSPPRPAPAKGDAPGSLTKSPGAASTPASIGTPTRTGFGAPPAAGKSSPSPFSKGFETKATHKASDAKTFPGKASDAAPAVPGSRQQSFKPVTEAAAPAGKAREAGPAKAAEATPGKNLPAAAPAAETKSASSSSKER